MVVKNYSTHICVLIITLFFMVHLVPLRVTGDVIINGVSYEPHDPIVINSNADFNFQNGVISGTGVKSDPWIIENLYINGEGCGSCFFIENTTDFFIIRNCYFEGASESWQQWMVYYPTGISISNVINGNISQNIIKNNDHGICLGLSHNNTIFNNTVTQNNIHGINLYRSDDNKIIGNTAHLNNYNGIYLDTLNRNIISHNNVYSNNGPGLKLGGPSSYNSIIKNIFMHNNVSGIYISGSNMNTFESNFISNNRYRGIMTIWAQNNTIQGNCIVNNSYGIYLKQSSNTNVITNNIIYNNSHGIRIESSFNNQIIQNHFVNKYTQAFDNSKNYWHSGYLSGGNYWNDFHGSDKLSGPNREIWGSDGFGDTPYSILGDNNYDLYPIFKSDKFSDLFIDINSIAFSPIDPRIEYMDENQGTYVIITVKNIGIKTAKNIEIQVYDMDEILWSNYLPQLDGNGSSNTVQFYWEPTEGVHNISFVINPVNYIFETNESNNNIPIITIIIGDSDDDGMPDEWEILYGFNITDPNDAYEDADYDGYINLIEYEEGTDPLNYSDHPRNSFLIWIGLLIVFIIVGAFLMINQRLKKAPPDN